MIYFGTGSVPILAGALLNYVNFGEAFLCFVGNFMNLVDGLYVSYYCIKTIELFRVSMCIYAIYCSEL